MGIGDLAVQPYYRAVLSDGTPYRPVSRAEPIGYVVRRSVEPPEGATAAWEQVSEIFETETEAEQYRQAMLK